MEVLKNTVLLSLFVMGVTGFSACQDAAEAEKKCKVIGVKYCEKHVEHCDMAVTQEACEDLYKENIRCEDALYVEEDVFESEYEQCLEAIEELDECPVKLPSECRGVIVIAEQDAGI